jgi:hypothetical protein
MTGEIFSSGRLPVEYILQNINKREATEVHDQVTLRSLILGRLDAVTG